MGDYVRVPLTPELRQKIFERDKYTCQYCGRSAPDVILNIDHIVPISKGGNNDEGNLITACRSCNVHKYNTILDDEYVQRLRNGEYPARLPYQTRGWVTYPAILSYDVLGDVGITFPDFPGCTGQCSDECNIFSYAVETLCFHLSGMMEDDEFIPEPSRIQDVKVEEAQTVIPVRVFLPAIRERLYGKAITRTVTLPYWLDKEAKNEGLNFSHELQNALMQKVGVRS